MRARPDRVRIKIEWIEQVIEHPVREVIQSDGRIRRYSRVILPADGETVHNAFFDRSFEPMKIRYFADTDTLYIEFRAAEVRETRDLDQDTLLDIDADGNICAVTIEHARTRTDIPSFSYEQVPA